MTLIENFLLGACWELTTRPKAHPIVRRMAVNVIVAYGGDL